MRTVAYCAGAFVDVTRRAAGVEPLTCPPQTAGTFDVALLEGAEFVYFDLHGQPNGDAWYGDDGLVALTAAQVREADLRGATVFGVNCNLADAGSPMMDALLEAGARYVIGGPGQNWGPPHGRLYGAPLLGYWVRVLMARGMEPLKALALAKIPVAAMGRGAADTLAFRPYYRRQDEDQA